MQESVSDADLYKLGILITSQYTQECLRCHHTIHRGTEVLSGALNVFTKDPIWMHVPCANFTLLRLGTWAVDDGWRQALHEQKCGRCREQIVVGQKIYRLWPERPSTNPTLTYVCHSCWRQANAQWLEELDA